MAQGIRCITIFFAALILAVVSEAAEDHVISPWNLSKKKEDYNAWAATRTFLPGQTLKFEFESGHNVVALASQEAYNNCDLSNPVRTFSEPNPVITLGSPGKKFYVCGVGNHCKAGMKVVINVVSSANDAAPPSGSADRGAATSFASSAVAVALGAAAVLAVL